MRKQYGTQKYTLTATNAPDLKKKSIGEFSTAAEVVLQMNLLCGDEPRGVMFPWVADEERARQLEHFSLDWRNGKEQAQKALSRSLCRAPRPQCWPLAPELTRVGRFLPIQLERVSHRQR